MIGLATAKDIEVPPSTKSVLDCINPYIGTAGDGRVFLGATVPFGMVQAGPVNGTLGRQWSSGYNYRDDFLVGFTQLHLSGTGIGDLNDLLIMPTTERHDLSVRCGRNPQSCPWKSGFSHDDEVAEPGYYSVFLKDPQVKVETTTTTRTAIYRMSYPKGKSRRLVLDLEFYIDPDKPAGASLERVDARTFVGSRFSNGWVKDQKVYFALRFSEPVLDEEHYDFKEKKAIVGKRLSSGRSIRSQFGFGQKDQALLVALGISSVSSKNALANLEEENPELDFDGTRRKAQERWQEKLAAISIETSDDAARTIFYTCLYRSMIAPNLFSDVNGQYRGADGAVYSKSFDYYTTLATWDTFRGFSGVVGTE